MIILRLSKEDLDLARNAARKFKRNFKRGLLLGDIASSDTAVYVMVPDEALSVAFVYGVYLKARERGLKADAIYATSVDLDKILPEDAKRVGEAWNLRRLSKKEIEMLKNRFITSSLLEVLLK